MSFEDVFNQIPEERKQLLFVSDLSEDFSGFLYEIQCRVSGSIIDVNNPQIGALDIIKDQRKYFENWFEKLIELKGKPYSDSDYLNKDRSIMGFEKDLEEGDEKLGQELMNELYKRKTPKVKLEIFEFEPHTLFKNFEVDNNKVVDEYPFNDFKLIPTIYYSNLPPIYRFKYLSWLADITQPIGKQYIITYLTGLERRAIESELEPVLEEIILLMNSHKDSLVIKRGKAAINNLCYYKGQLPQLNKLFQENIQVEMSNYLLEYFVINNLDLTPSILLSFYKEFNFQLKIVKGYEKIFLDAIENILLHKFNSNVLPFGSMYDLNDFPKVKMSFSNRILNEEIGGISIFNFMGLDEFRNEVTETFELSYELFKKLKKENRKK